MLYAKNGNYLSSERDSLLYMIDPTSAAVSVLGDTGTALGGGLAFVIPEPTTLSLLSVALLATGWRRSTRVLAAWAR